MMTRQRFIRLMGLVGIVALLAVALPRVLGYLIQGPQQPQGDTDIRFTQIPIDFEHRTDLENSLPFLGIAAIDIDGDGIDEVFIGGGTHQDDAILRFTDRGLVRIAAPGISKQKGDATFGAASIDATRDGRADLFVARESGLYFYENVGGHFEGRKIEFPLEEHSVPLSIALGDINRDGAVDLYVSNYLDTEFVEGETIFNGPYGAYSNLLLNRGDNTFVDITSDAGLYHQHNTFVSVFVDLDNDRWSDLVIAHDTGTVGIYRNNGDLTFSEMPNPTVYSYPMGIAVTDIDQDGLMDLYFSNVGVTLPEMLVRGDLRKDQTLNRDYMLLQNKGNFVFEDVAKQRNAANYGFGWGVVSYDFNNDTRRDFLIAQNYVRFPGVSLLELYPGNLLQQYDDGTYKPVEKNARILNEHFGISPMIADFNDDGWPDIVWANVTGPATAFLNVPSKNHWLKVRLSDAPSSIGAIVRVRTASGRTFADQFITSQGLCSDQTHEIFFGLGEIDSIDSVTVSYQDGHESTKDAPPVDTTVSFAPSR